jgi:dTDP-glucose pyrophosphorylase
MANYRLNNLTVQIDTPLIKAIELMTRAAEKILLVVDDDGRLIGVMTDYDIRYALLDKFSLNDPIEKMIGTQPVVGHVGMSDAEIIELIERTRCFQIPIVDGDRRLVDIRFIHEFMHLSASPREVVAVVMAGGLGARLRPLTEHTPKPLLRIGGEPILFIMLDRLLSDGFTKIYLTLCYKSQMIVDTIRAVPRYQDKVHFIIEKEPLGTAGSLSLLSAKPLAPFLVINADLLTDVPLGQMRRFHGIENNVITMATKRETYVMPYGVAEIDDGRVLSLREKPEFTLFVNAGAYIVSPQVLDLIGSGVRIDMPDVVNMLLENELRVGSFPIHEDWIDIGTPEQYDQARNKGGGSAFAEADAQWA